ncbi:hypothetical protein RJ640_009528 [Escallonia rubra]|uniref:Uncharacterized protein n=1 Tax=Escallonia rubra TaxID=112253 RepID=A0AA88UBL8_9ASTE|nr:hypothetical protein RJ640_009528 [Escallonia rubra]
MERALAQFCPTVCSSDSALLEIGRTISRPRWKKNLITFVDVEVSDIMKIVPMPFKVPFKLSSSSDVVSSSDS